MHGVENKTCSACFRNISLRLVYLLWNYAIILDNAESKHFTGVAENDRRDNGRCIDSNLTR